MTGESGFTLIEVMVATFIMAILSAMGIAMLSNTLEAREEIETVVADVEELQLARAIIRQDLAQLVNRRARDPYGTRQASAFEGGLDPTGERLMSFVRTGYTLPGVAGRRSRLQHVTYFYRQGTLVRQSRAFVDAAPDPAKHSRILIDGLDSLNVSFRSGNGWSDVFEAATPTNAGPVPAPPAVRLDFSHDRFGPVECVFLTVAGP
ncbi:MAG: type II secretion system minor pseudopilin GspJ [Alphaproteobacteria bacterium]|jgi:general secretion pathway protein J|nr:type II secretion system minor pseudopilin GspJ [Alphaproteobacteria bacterium]